MRSLSPLLYCPKHNFLNKSIPVISLLHLGKIMRGSDRFRNIVQYEEVVEPLPEVFRNYTILP